MGFDIVDSNMSADLGSLKGVLVTGGGGFIGKPLVSVLSDHVKVVSLDIKDNNGRKAGVESLKADITDKEALQSALEGVEFDAAIHLAALKRGSKEDIHKVLHPIRQDPLCRIGDMPA